MSSFNLGSLLLRLLPTYNRRIYAFCSRYVERFNADNNDDMATNGELRFLRRAVPESDVVFDVGANVGDWTTHVLSFKPDVQVHLFEPNQGAFNTLTSRSFPRNVHPNHFGLSATAGVHDLYVFSEGAGTNSLYRRHGLEDGWGMKPQERTERIALNTLDAYCDEHQISSIDLLKVDVEGHELEVFKGAHRMLSTHRIHMIQFEYGGANIDAGVLLKDIFGLFSGLPYAFYKVYPERLCHIPRYDQRLETLQYQNWVILHTSINGDTR